MMHKILFHLQDERAKATRRLTQRSGSSAAASSNASEVEDVSPQGSQSGRVIGGTFAEPTTGIPPQRARAKRSFIWKHGKKVQLEDGKEYCRGSNGPT